MSATALLSEIPLGSSSRVVGLSPATNPKETAIASRLVDLGFFEGESVEVIAEAPWSRDPIVVQVGASIIALRRSEAQLVCVAQNSNATEQVP